MSEPAPRRDVALLFAARSVRLFAYGFLSVVLVLYLTALGFSEERVGLLLSLTLLGDTAVSLLLTTRADRLGRKATLIAGAGLMLLAGVAFAASRDFWVLLAAATVGVLSPAGNEVGPFLAVEQAALSQQVPADRRTHVFAWYALAGSLATAAGALASGGLVQLLEAAGRTPLDAYRAVIAGYAGFGLVLAALFGALSPRAEAAPASPPAGARTLLGLHRSRKMVLGLAGLFAVDAFAGGFVVQSFVAFWFHRRFGAEPATLGAIFFVANALAGLSALAAARVAARIGLVRTMVFTHLPSNVLLLLVPLMPTLGLAMAVLFLRFAISQMDVPTRQSYTLAVVDPDERSAAAGVTGVARTVGSALAPVLAGPLYATAALAGVPFFVAGGLKIAYDLVLFALFKSLPAPEERTRSGADDEGNRQ